MICHSPDFEVAIREISEVYAASLIARATRETLTERRDAIRYAGKRAHDLATVLASMPEGAVDALDDIEGVLFDKAGGVDEAASALYRVSFLANKYFEKFPKAPSRIPQSDAEIHAAWKLLRVFERFDLEASLNIDSSQAVGPVIRAFAIVVRVARSHVELKPVSLRVATLANYLREASTAEY